MNKFKALVTYLLVISFMFVTGCVYQNNKSPKPLTGNIKVTIKVKKSALENPELVLTKYDYMKLWVYTPGKTKSFSEVLTKLPESDSKITDSLKEVFADPDTGVKHAKTEIKEKLAETVTEDYIIEDVPIEASYIAFGIPGEGVDVEFVNIKGKVQAGKTVELDKEVILNARPDKSATYKAVAEMFGGTKLTKITVAGPHNGWRQYDDSYKMLDEDGDGVYTYTFSGVAPGEMLYKFNPQGDISWAADAGWSADPMADALVAVPGITGKFNSIGKILGKSVSKFMPVVGLIKVEPQGTAVFTLGASVSFDNYLALSETEKRTKTNVVATISEYSGKTVIFEKNVGNDGGTAVSSVALPYSSTYNEYSVANLRLPALAPDVSAKTFLVNVIVTDPNNKVFTFTFPMTQIQTNVSSLKVTADNVLALNRDKGTYNGEIVLDASAASDGADAYLYYIEKDGKVLDGFPLALNDKKFTWKIVDNNKAVTNLEGKYVAYVTVKKGETKVTSKKVEFNVTYEKEVELITLGTPDNLSLVGSVHGADGWSPNNFPNWHLAKQGNKNIWIITHTATQAAGVFKFAANDNWNGFAPYSQFGARLERFVKNEKPMESNPKIEDDGTEITFALDNNEEFTGELVSEIDGRKFKYGPMNNKGDFIYGNLEYARNGAGGANSAQISSFKVGSPYRYIVNMEKDPYTFTSSTGEERTIGGHTWYVELTAVTEFDTKLGDKAESTFALGETVTLNADVAGISSASAVSWKVIVDGMAAPEYAIEAKKTTSFVTLKAGEHVIKLTATYPDKTVKEFTKIINVGAPIIYDGSAFYGNTVKFSSRGTYANYNWTFISPTNVVAGKTGMNVDFIPKEVGTYTVRLTTDNGVMTEKKVKVGIKATVATDLNVTEKDEFTVSLPNDSYFDEVIWSIDGQKLAETGYSFTWKPAAGIKAGNHYVDVMAFKNGVAYKNTTQIVSVNIPVVLKSDTIDVLNNEKLGFYVKTTLPYDEVNWSVDGTKFTSNVFEGTWTPEGLVPVAEGAHKLTAEFVYGGVKYTKDVPFTLAINYVLTDANDKPIKQLTANTKANIKFVSAKTFTDYRWEFDKEKKLILFGQTIEWKPLNVGKNKINITLVNGDERYSLVRDVIVIEDFIPAEYATMNFVIDGASKAMAYNDNHTWKLTMPVVTAGAFKFTFAGEKNGAAVNFGGRTSEKKGLSLIADGVTTDYNGYLSIAATPNEITVNLESGYTYEIFVNTNTLTYNIYKVKSTVQLVGTMTSWTPSDAANDMVYVGNGVYEKVITAPAAAGWVAAPNNQGFKFTGNSNWAKDGGFEFGMSKDGENTFMVTDKDGGVDNLYAALVEGKKYKVTLDVVKMTYSIKPLLETVQLVGTMTSWTPGDAANNMTDAGNGVYTKVITAPAAAGWVAAPNNQGFKFTANANWAKDGGFEFGMSKDGENTFMVADKDGVVDNLYAALVEGKKYTVTIDTVKMTYSIKPLVETVQLVGTMTSWTPGDAANTMTEVGNGVYEKIITAPAAAGWVAAPNNQGFKFTANANWAKDGGFEFGMSKDGENTFIATDKDGVVDNLYAALVEGKKYRVTIDIVKMTYSIKPLIETMQLVGTMTSWTPGDAGNTMTYVGNGIYEKEITAPAAAGWVAAPNNQGFKFTANGNWAKDGGFELGMSKDGENAFIVADKDGVVDNLYANLVEGKKYKVVLNIGTMKYEIVRSK